MEGTGHVRRMTKAQRVAYHQHRADLKELMSQPWGRRLMWRWLSDARVFHPVFSTNAMEMACNEGRRLQGLKLLSDLQEHCPDLYARMQREHWPNDVPPPQDIDDDADPE